MSRVLGLLTALALAFGLAVLLAEAIDDMTVAAITTIIAVITLASLSSHSSGARHAH
ncbi:hypothetical protein [Sphingomonas sp. LaA6.9]|uniref:hypothetical protein n=1 Tax=Sphingomonas sp. LaA6.9 TaxID=2919914 RepID=UPI001F4FC596|nr:hypothetical protein [Sphingomonas sp. LaA6.9]MCJ8159386.1 hypothetical protein [Sphingomonas sp. LaA6.9]